MMKCIWCDKETTIDKKNENENLKFANKEHVFPESIGGIKTLEQGKVCEDCNNRLGNDVDRFLKTGNHSFAAYYQYKSKMQGKPMGKVRDKIDKERKNDEICGIRINSNKASVFRNYDNFNEVKFVDVEPFKYSENFSKALHKCALNAVLDKTNYDYVKKNYQELIDYINIKDNKKHYNWSYGVSYSLMYLDVDFEPTPILLSNKYIDDIFLGVILIFPCVICVVTLKPDLMSCHLLKMIGDNPPYPEGFPEEFDYLKYFDPTGDRFDMKYGDILKFSLVKKE